MIAHFVAYPLAAAWAFAWVPLAIRRAVQSGFELPEALPRSPLALFAATKPVLTQVVWPAAIVFVAAHFVGLPWAFAKDEKGRRYGSRFWLATGTLGAVGALGAIGSWVWLWFFS
jgi:hypothetical protein